MVGRIVVGYAIVSMPRHADDLSATIPRRIQIVRAAIIVPVGVESKTEDQGIVPKGMVRRGIVAVIVMRAMAIAGDIGYIDIAAVDIHIVVVAVDVDLRIDRAAGAVVVGGRESG